MAELGVISAKGRNGTAELLEIIAKDEDDRIPEVARLSLIVLARQYAAITTDIGNIEKHIHALHRSCEESRRLAEIPGVGPIVATALIAEVGDWTAFSSGRHDVIYLDATDPSQPYGYNPLRHVREDRIALAASGMMDVFKKMWPEAWGVRMEHILRNVLMALLEQPDAILHEVLRIFSDKEFRRSVGKSLRNETVRTFLLKEFDQFSFGYRADGTAPIQNKVGAFLADPLLNRILTAPEKDLRIRQIMDKGQVLLVNLAKGRIGEDSSSLLGALLVTAIGLAAYSRADMPAEERKNFFVYVDEFQSFTTLAMADMLSELRKYRVCFTIAHQYLHQLEPDIRHAVLGNVGSVISFRVGAEDAPYLVREFHEKFALADFLQLPNHRIYLKLMIDGTPSAPFSAATLAPESTFLLGH